MTERGDLPSVTTWTRIEPRCTSADPTRWKHVAEAQLEARIEDPLWLLARQWQLGELDGEDAGTPIQAELRAATVSLTHYRLGDAPQTAELRDAKGNILPLEPLVEREPLIGIAGDAATELRLAAELGLHLLWLLDRALHAAPDERRVAYRASYLERFPIGAPDPVDGDEDARRFATIIAGRAPNGHTLSRRLASPAGLLDELGIHAEDRAAVTAVHDEWLAWVANFVSVPPPGAQSAWDSSRLEYRFEASAVVGGRTTHLIRAPEHLGELDWHSFDIAALAATPAAGPTETRLLAELAYPGMPNRRFWEFEDARVDFGQLTAAPGDVARLLVTGFAVDYGNDWYLLPLTMPIGTLCTIERLVVRTTFGENILAAPFRRSPEEGGVRVFELTGVPSPAPPLLVPPIGITDRISGQPLEEVQFLRDELANVGLAIERIIPGPTGQPILPTIVPDDSGPEQDLAADLVYRLRRDPPPGWIPLVPRSDGRRLLLDVIGRGRGRILRETEALQEEELGLEGFTLTRRFERTRWTDGSTWLWIGRSKRPGARAASGGLRFDIVEHTAD